MQETEHRQHPRMPLMLSSNHSPTKVAIIQTSKDVLHFLKLNTDFEIIVDSYAVVRNNTVRSHVPCTWFPAMVTE